MNNALIKHFQVLAKYYKESGDKGRAIAYTKAVSILRSLQFPIKSVKDVNNVPGIGPKIKEKIDEFLKGGSIRVVAEKRREMESRVKTPREIALEDFETVWGIGPKKALKLYDEEGIKSLEELEKNKHLLTDQQRIGLKYREDLLQKIPREKMHIINGIIRLILNKYFLPGSYEMEIAGSYRRKARASGDIDCLICTNKFTLKQVVKALKAERVVIATLSVREQKFMGIIRCPAEQKGAMRLDIEFVPRKSWASALLYFTGSKEFNTMIRARAKKMGYLLNEHGLFRLDTKKQLLTSTETDIFTILELPDIPPDAR